MNLPTNQKGLAKHSSEASLPPSVPQTERFSKLTQLTQYMQNTKKAVNSKMIEQSSNLLALRQIHFLWADAVSPEAYCPFSISDRRLLST